MADEAWWPLSELNAEAPDYHHPWTVDNLDVMYGASEHLVCWRKEHVQVELIDPFQLLDDPDDLAGESKVESIRGTLRAGKPLPAVIIVHHPEEEKYPYRVIEGRHRYNAVHREKLPRIFAWVAHLSCCGSPAAV